MAEEEWRKVVERDRKEKQKNASFEPILVIDHEVLRQNGYERASRLMERQGWKQVMEVQEHVYKDLTMKFLTTFTCSTDGSGPIKFHLANQPIIMTCDEICEAFGVPTGGMQGLGEDSVNYFWREIAPGHGDFHSGRSLLSMVQDPILKCILQLLSRTVFFREKGTEKLNNQDIVALYSMVHDHHQDIGFLWKEMVAAKLRNKITAIGLGPYVTMLARYNRFPGLDRQKKVNLPPWVLTDRHLINWKLMGRGEPVRNPLQEEADEIHEAETGTGRFAGGSSLGGDGSGPSNPVPRQSERGTRRTRHTGYDSFDFSAFDNRLGELEANQIALGNRLDVFDTRITDINTRLDNRWALEDERYRNDQEMQQRMWNWMTQFPPPGPQQ